MSRSSRNPQRYTQQARFSQNVSQQPSGPHREWIRTGFRFIGWGIFLLIPILNLYKNASLSYSVQEALWLLATNHYVWFFTGLILVGSPMLCFYFDFNEFKFRVIRSRRAIWNFKNYVFLFTFIPFFGMVIAFFLSFSILISSISPIYPHFVFWADLFHADPYSFDFSVTPLIFLFIFYTICMFLGHYLGYGRWIRFWSSLSSHHHHHYYWHPHSYDDDYYISSKLLHIII